MYSSSEGINVSCMPPGTEGFMTGFAFPEILTAMNAAAKVHAARKDASLPCAHAAVTWDPDSRDAIMQMLCRVAL